MFAIPLVIIFPLLVMLSILVGALVWLTSSQNTPISTLPARKKIVLADGQVLEGPDKALGNGAFGNVYQYALNKVNVAVKIPKNIKDNELQKSELSLLKKANSHPQIIKLLAAVEIDKKTWIVMELMQGSVRDLLDNVPTLSIHTKLSIALQIAKGVAYLHNLTNAYFSKKSIIHQDLKPTNILVDKLEDREDIQVKIVDFGLSREMDHLKLPLVGTVFSKQANGNVGGTLLYSSPEIARALLKEQDFEGGLKCDIFSIGIILWELATTCTPRRTKQEIIDGKFKQFINDKELSKKSSNKKLRSNYPKTGFFGPIIDQCIQTDPNNRLSATTLTIKLQKVSIDKVKSTNKTISM